MTNIAAAILALDSTAQVSVNADDINQITWHDGNPTNITNEQILEKQVELQSEYDAEEWNMQEHEKLHILPLATSLICSIGIRSMTRPLGKMPLQR